jgi:LysM repeat protein
VDYLPDFFCRGLKILPRYRLNEKRGPASGAPVRPGADRDWGRFVRSASPHRKSKKVRRTGRHRRPSQVQKAARRAGRAAPALAVSGALAAAPYAAESLSASPALAATASHASHATGAAALRAVSAHLDTAVQSSAQQARSYTVQTGNTLSGIAQQFYGQASYWPWLYQVNTSAISDPNLIYTGQVLSVPAEPPATAGTQAYQPRHAATSDAGGSASSGAASGQQSALVCPGSGGGMLPQNYATIVSFLTAHGYTGLAAAGIAGNIFQESGGNPESVGSGGGGLIGFTPLPSGLVTGDPSADLQAQLEAILSYNQQWSAYVPALNAAASAVQAADIYMNDFERPGIPMAGNREGAAAAVAQACGL